MELVFFFSLWLVFETFSCPQGGRVEGYFLSSIYLNLHFIFVLFLSPQLGHFLRLYLSSLLDSACWEQAFTGTRQPHTTTLSFDYGHLF